MVKKPSCRNVPVGFAYSGYFVLLSMRMTKVLFKLSLLYFQAGSRRESNADGPGNQNIPAATVPADSLLDFRRIQI